MKKGDFEKACLYDKLGIIPIENEGLDRFIERAYLTLNYSKYIDENYPEISSDLFFDAVTEVKNLIDMNLCWVDARYKNLDLIIGKCQGKLIKTKGNEICIPNIFVDKEYSDYRLRGRCKMTLRHEIIHAGRFSFNFYEMNESAIIKKTEDYLVKWLGNHYGSDSYNIDEFVIKNLGLKNPLHSDIYPKLKLIDVVRKKLRDEFGKHKSLYIISRLLDKEREIISNETDIGFFVKYKPGLKWDIIRKKVYG